MPSLHCQIKLGEIPLHLYPILSGFLLLERKGAIKIEWLKLKKSDPRVAYNMLEVIVNREQRLLYDVNDGYDNLLSPNESYIEFYNQLLTKVDFCLKRSFDLNRNRYLDESKKLIPLGLNYMTTVSGNLAHMPMPQDPSIEKIKKLIRLFPLTQHYNGFYNMKTFEALPEKDQDPKILFMARLWDVEGDYTGQLSSEKKEERAYINEFRAACIRMCQKEFGHRFIGGVTPTPFANNNYSDLVVDPKLTKRNHYLRRMKASSICIATMGLHQSIGWKFAEYVAASRAIITEELKYELPGPIKEDQNYLVFKSPEECVSRVCELIENDYLRYQMKVNNYNYYINFVRPDALIWNSLMQTMAYTKEPVIQQVGGYKKWSCC